MPTIRILFLCSSNSCRSQMAEGFARTRQPADCEIYSAGIQATSLHPMAVKAMGEIGIDISKQKSKPLKDVEGIDFDIVITLCAMAAQQCPVFRGHAHHVKWNLPDPAAVTGDEEKVRAAFRESRDQIRRLVDDFFDRGYLSSLVEAKRSEDLILSNIADGILAHDLTRRIFYFNRAAEAITGYSRDEVIARDCRDVFAGGLCGGKCQFDNGAATFGIAPVRNEVEIATKDGERRILETSLKRMVDGEDRAVGVLVSFHDVTRERTLARRLGEIQQFSGIIGRDAKMLEVFDLIREFYLGT